MTRILDKNDRELQYKDIDYNKGKLVDDTITVHHPAVEAVQEVSHIEVVKEYYEMDDNGQPVLDDHGNKVVFGKDVRTVIDTPGVEAKEAYDEQEQIQRYVPYTTEELNTIAKKNADTLASAAVAAAEKSALRIMVATMAPSLSTDELLSVAAILPDWDSSKTYSKDDVVRYQQSLYQAVGNVAANTVPDSSADEWKNLTKPVGDVKQWIQPTSAEDAYDVSAVVMHNNQQWRSNVNYNAHEPGVDGWTSENDAVKAWTQPTGVDNAYAEGARVRHNDKEWVSMVSGNVWEPGASGVTQWREASEE